MKRTLILVCLLLGLLALLSAGCETSFPEWSGNMTNETGQHVQGENRDQPDTNTEIVKPHASLNVINMSLRPSNLRVPHPGRLTLVPLGMEFCQTPAPRHARPERKSLVANPARLVTR